MAKCKSGKCKRSVLAPDEYCYAHYQYKLRAAQVRKVRLTRQDEGWDNGVLATLLYGPRGEVDKLAEHRADLSTLLESLEKLLTKI